MNDVVVQLEAVGKRYRLGEHHGAGFDLRDTIGRAFGKLRRVARASNADIWSLRDVWLDVKEGEAVGIIGRNGSGKSTLLKVVSNITTPTEGRCRTRGRVGSLLEVGTGFHDELTGFENTYLNGAILGMSKRDVDARLDDIVEFAGLERFMDTPVKRYSSGMYLRLGFAIAAHMEVEVLVVDEVLAVGDAEFQERCLGKMREVERSGRTVLFVSHDLDAIARLCPRAVWLDQGRVRADGPTPDVVQAYLPRAEPERAIARLADERDASAYIDVVAVVDDLGAPISLLPSGQGATIVIGVMLNEPYPGLDVAVVCTNGRGVIVLDECLRDVTALDAETFVPGRYELRYELPGILPAGEYTLSVWIGSQYEDGETHDQVVSFRVDGVESRLRAIRLERPWAVHRV